MVREIRLARVRTGLLLSGAYDYTAESNFHIEVQGQDQAEVHIPMSTLSAAIKANPEGTFKPEFRALVLWDDDFSNPIRWAGPIVTVTPTWDKSELVIGAQGISYTLDRIPAISSDDRAGNNDARRVWKISGNSYQELVNHLISSSTNETSDGIKLPQAWGSLPWSAGDLSKSIELTNPPQSVWSVIDEIRQGPNSVETVFVPQLSDSTHIAWVPVVGTKAAPYYKKSTNLGAVDLSDATRGVTGFTYTNDAGERTASWFFGSSNTTQKGNDNYTDLTGKWKTAPSGDVEFMHTFSGEQFDSELSSTELSTQIDARTADSGTDYKSYEVSVFDETFQYTGHLGKTLTATDSTRMAGLSEGIRITAVDWDIDDPSTVKVTVLPQNLTVFPRVPRHDNDNKNTDNPTKSGPKVGSGTGTTNTAGNSKPEITTPSPLIAGTKGQPYTATIFATGNPTPTFSLKSGSELPLGLSLSKSGQITGSPMYQSDSVGNKFTIVATNKNGTDEKEFTLVVNASTATLPGYDLGEGDTDAIIASGVVSVTALNPKDPGTLVQNGADVYMLTDGGQAITAPADLGKSFAPITVKRATFDSTGKLVGTDTSVGVFPAANLNTVRAGIPDVSINGAGRSGEFIKIDTYFANNRLYVYLSCAVTFGFGASIGTWTEPTAVRYQTAVYYGTLDANKKITSWTSAFPITLAEYPGAQFRPITRSITAYGPNKTRIGCYGVEILRDTGYTGPQGIDVQNHPYLQLVVEQDYSSTPNGNGLWSLGSRPPYLPLTPNVGPATKQWWSVNDYPQQEPLAVHTGSDAYVYCVQQDWYGLNGGGTPPNSTAAYGPNYAKSDLPEGIGVYRAYVKNGSPQTWERVSNQGYTDANYANQNARDIVYMNGRVVYTAYESSANGNTPSKLAVFTPQSGTISAVGLNPLAITTNFNMRPLDLEDAGGTFPLGVAQSGYVPTGGGFVKTGMPYWASLKTANDYVRKWGATLGSAPDYLSYLKYHFGCSRYFNVGRTAYMMAETVQYSSPSFNGVASYITIDTQDG